MRRIILIIYLVVTLASLVGGTQAATITVCPNGCEYSSIQAAINAANPGDTIEAHSGYYNEQVIMNKDVKLVGIDTGEGTPGIMAVHRCGHPDSSITGFALLINAGDCDTSQSNVIIRPGAQVTVGGHKVEPSDVSSGLIYSDDFSNDKSGWSTSTANVFSSGYKIGKYQIIAQNGMYTSVCIPPIFTNFAIEVEASIEEGSSGSDYGVILRRVDDDNFYRFKFSESGYYSCDKKQNGQWIDIIPWTSSSAIQTGKATNIIKAECEGDMFTFYVNGVKLRGCKDSSFASGSIGLEVGSSDGIVQASFDNLKIWAL